MPAIMNSIEKLLLVVLFFLLSGIVLIIGFQVFCRYALGAPLTWSEEVARYLMVWFSLFGTVLGVRHYSHVGVDFVVEKLPANLRLFTRVLGQIVSFAFIAIVTMKGLELSVDKFFIPSPAASIPMGVVYMSIPVAGFLMSVFQVENIIKDFLPRPVSLSKKLDGCPGKAGGDV